MSSDRIWVEANFKETELTHMRPGQSATIEVDTYPDAVLTGKVESLSPGTGLVFSLLPAENATGNWVKVVQRLPVRVLGGTGEMYQPILAYYGLSRELIESWGGRFVPSLATAPGPHSTSKSMAPTRPGR